MARSKRLTPGMRRQLEWIGQTDRFQVIDGRSLKALRARGLVTTRPGFSLTPEGWRVYRELEREDREAEERREAIRAV